MLLRHNTCLKNVYKYLCGQVENVSEDSFSMDLVTFWKFIKDIRITDSIVTIA